MAIADFPEPRLHMGAAREKQQRRQGGANNGSERLGAGSLGFHDAAIWPANAAMGSGEIRFSAIPQLFLDEHQHDV